MATGHLLRLIRELLNAALKELDEDVNALYSDLGRYLIPPEKFAERTNHPP
jgi:hypothetical protein